MIAIAIAALSLAQAALAETSDQVRDAQNMLSRLGIYFGPVTGQFDQATLASFTTWLFSHNLPASTTLNAKTLKLMAKDLGEDDKPEPPPAQAAKPDAQLPWYVILVLSLAVPL
jgi:hypothetical protein